MTASLNRLSIKVILTILAFLLLLAATTAFLITLGFRETEKDAVQRSVQGLESQGGESLLHLTQREAEINDIRLGQAVTLGQTAVQYLVTMSQAGGQVPWNSSSLTSGPEGQLYDPTPDRRSEVWIGSYLTTDPSTERDLQRSAVLDTLVPASLAQVPDAIALYYMSPQGIGRYYPVVDLVEILPADFSVTTQPYFALAAPPANPARGAVWSEPYIDLVGQGLIVTVSTPVYGGDEFWGVLGVDVSLARLIDRLNGLSPTPGGYAFLVDDSGHLVAAPPAALDDILGKSQVGKTWSMTETLGLSLVDSATSPFVDTLAAMQAGSSGLDQFEVAGRQVFVAYAPLPNVGWSLALVAPVDEITAQAEQVAATIHSEANRTIRLTLLLMGAFFLVALAGTIVLSRHSLTKPIEALVAGTRAVAAGDLEVTIPVTSRDELGLLALSFNRMTARLAEAYEQLQEEVTEHKRAEDSLRESEERFRRAFEHAPFGMALVGADGSFLRVNQSICTMFGYSEQELLKRTFQEITYPADLDTGVDLFHELLVGTRDYGWMEKRYVRQDGGVIWTLLSTSAVRDRQGATLYLVSQVQDITERKRAEADLAEREEQYRSIFEATSDGLIINTLDGDTVEANPALCEMLGYSRQELLDMHPTAYIHPDGHAQFRKSLQMVRAGERFRGQGVDLRKDGSPFYVEVHNTPFAYRGEPHALGVVRDVTEQVLNQQMLEERVAARTRELSALYDVTAVASASLNLETVMEQSVDRVLEVMGCEIGAIHLLDEAEGQVYLTSWRNVPAEIIPEIQRMPLGSGVAGRVIEQGSPLVVPAMSNDPDAVPAAQRLLGEQVYVGAPMRAKGQVLGVLSVIGEAGRQFNAEEVALLASIADQVGVAVENARLYQQAEQLAIMEERQRLARELHDSVTQSLYSTNLMAETGRRAAEAGDLPAIEQVLGRLGQVTHEALKEMRLLIYELRPLSLEREGLVGALQQRLDAVEGRAGVETRLLVEGQVNLTEPAEGALFRIGQEALNNALKHAAATSVLVRIRAGGETLTLEVIDNGRGFDPRAAARAGGIGLITMRERAEKLGGKLEILSRPGEGTQVRVTVQAAGIHRATAAPEEIT